MTSFQSCIMTIFMGLVCETMAAEGNYPYSNKEPTGVDFGRGMGLAVPSWLLFLIFLGVVAGVAYLVQHLFKAQEPKKVIDIKADKRARKLSKKKSKHTE